MATVLCQRKGFHGKVEFRLLILCLAGGGFFLIKQAVNMLLLSDLIPRITILGSICSIFFSVLFW